MATPTHPTHQPAHQADKAVPETKTVPDEGHPNAADKPFHERTGGGAQTPAARKHDDKGDHDRR